LARAGAGLEGRALVMQTGTVLYLTDSSNVPDDLDDARLIAEAGLEPGWTELAASSDGWLPVEAAVHRLIVRGAHVPAAVKVIQMAR